VGKIVAVVCILAVILIAVALYTGSKQKLFVENYSRDLQASLLEAREVKCDLEEMMLNTINLSRELVDGLESKIPIASKVPAQNVPSVSAASSQELPQEKKARKQSRPLPDAAGGVKIRVYEMAEEIGMNTREFMRLCQESGFAVSHHMNVMSEEQISYFRQGRHLQQPESKQEVLDEVAYAEESCPEAAECQENCLPQNLIQPKMEFSLEEVKQAHPYIAVRMLSEQGFNQKEIAQILDRGQGEVSLILNLAKKKQVG